MTCVYCIKHFLRHTLFNSFISYHFLFLILHAILYLVKHLFFQLLYSLEPIGLNSENKVNIGMGYQKDLLRLIDLI